MFTVSTVCRLHVYRYICMYVHTSTYIYIYTHVFVHMHTGIFKAHETAM